MKKNKYLFKNFLFQKQDLMLLTFVIRQKKIHMIDKSRILQYFTRNLKKKIENLWKCKCFELRAITWPVAKNYDLLISLMN